MYPVLVNSYESGYLSKLKLIRLEDNQMVLLFYILSIWIMIVIGTTAMTG